MTTEEGPWASGSDGKSDWSEATRHLSGRDPVLRARIGPCTLVPRPNVSGTASTQKASWLISPS